MIARIRETAFTRMMVCRNEKGLTEALDLFKTLETDFTETRIAVTEVTKENAEEVRAAKQLESMLLVAQVLAGAMLLRRESRGAHYREDYPGHDETMAKNIVEYMAGDEPTVGFES